MHYGAVTSGGALLREDSDRVRGAVAAAEAERLSVVMPVRNALPYLDDAVRSILGQSHGDFEFVIGDDASTDGSTESAARLGGARPAHPAVRAARPARPGGELQLGGRQGRGAADRAHGRRRHRPSGPAAAAAAVLAARPDAALVGSPPVGIDDKGRVVREQMRWTIGNGGFSAPFAHGSILFRRAAFDRVGGYRAQCAYWEDIDLYLRMARIGAVLVLPDALYYYRFADTSTRLTSSRGAGRGRRWISCCAAATRYLKGEDYAPCSTPPGRRRSRRIEPASVPVDRRRAGSGRAPRPQWPGGCCAAPPFRRAGNPHWPG